MRKWFQFCGIPQNSPEFTTVDYRGIALYFTEFCIIFLLYREFRGISLPLVLWFATKFIPTTFAVVSSSWFTYAEELGESIYITWHSYGLFVCLFLACFSGQERRIIWTLTPVYFLAGRVGRALGSSAGREDTTRTGRSTDYAQQLTVIIDYIRNF